MKTPRFFLVILITLILLSAILLFVNRDTWLETVSNDVGAASVRKSPDSSSGDKALSEGSASDAASAPVPTRSTRSS